MWREAAKWAGLLLTAAALTVACTSGEAEPEHDHADQPVEFLNESDIARIIAETDGFQGERLADGRVTFAEYEKATLAAVDCIRRSEIAGGNVAVDGPHPWTLSSGRVDDRFLVYQVEAESEGQARNDDATQQWGLSVGDEIDRIATACREQYLINVDRVWTFQHLLPPDERDRQRGLIIECLRTAGVDVDAGATDEDIVRLAMENPDHTGIMACRDSYLDFFLLGVH